MRTTLAYDDDCGACRWTADHLRKWDRSNALAFAAIQRADELLASVPVEERLDAMHAVTPDGRVYTAGAAVPVILRALPGGRPIAAVTERFPAATERLYRAVAARRSRIGRLLGQRACAVDPSGASGG